MVRVDSLGISKHVQGVLVGLAYLAAGESETEWRARAYL